MRRWIVLSVLMMAITGCTPDRLAILGTLTDSDGSTTGDFEITNAVTEVYTTGSAEAVFKVKAVTKRGRVLPLRKWRCTKQIGLTTTMVAQGNQKQVEDEVEISIPLLDGQGRGQNIGITFVATTWRKEQTFMLTSIDAGMVTLTMAREGQGSVSPEAGPHRYLPGMYVALEATPDAGWQFVGWQGNVLDAENSSTGITLGSADETVTAFFEKKVQPGTRAALYLTRNPEGLVVDFYLGDRPMPDTWEGLPSGVGFSNISGLGLVALPQDLSRRYFEFLPVEPLDPVAPIITDMQFVGSGYDETGGDATFDFTKAFWLVAPGITLNQGPDELYMPKAEEIDVYNGEVRVLPSANGYYLIGSGAEMRIVDQSSNIDVVVGERVVMFVLVSGGEGVLTYQWCKGGTNPQNFINGAKNPELIFPAVAKNDGGTYYCIISDGVGQKTTVGFTK